MTGSALDDLVHLYAGYLARVEPAAAGQARARVLGWLRNGVPDMQVRVRLAAPTCTPLPTGRPGTRRVRTPRSR